MLYIPFPYFYHPFVSTLQPDVIYQEDSGWPLKETKKVIDISEDQYTINITYPEYYLRGQPIHTFNSMIDSELNDYVQNFRKSANDLAFPNGQKSVLIGYYTTYTAINRYITVKSDRYPYFGGAHPGHDIITTTFDTASDSIIDLSDLFQENTNYLEALSKFSEKALFDKYPDLTYAFIDPTFRKGFAPRKENFTHWALTDAGFIIFFPEYQVAPYAAGTLDVLIPFEKFFV